MNHATAREGSHPARRSGMVTFASYMLIVAGFFHVIAGLAALFRSGVYLVGSGQLVALDYTQWGWVHLLFGVLLFFAATALFSGRMWARVLTIILAAASAIANFGFIRAYPVWSILIIVLDVMVIYAVAMHNGYYDEDEDYV